MLGKLKINQISLGGLELKSESYMFSLSGLFDHEKTMHEAELYSDGSFIASSKVNAKKMALTGYIKNNDFNSHVALNKVFRNKSKQELRVVINDSIVLTSYVVVESISSNDENIKTCQLVAHDPYIYGDEMELNINSYHSGVSFPLSLPVRFGNDSKVENILNNDGTEVSYPIIEIKGPCVNPSISNITTNERLTFNGLELFVDDTLVIDNRPRTRSIKINGDNRIDLKNGSWISCSTGLNEFRFNKISSTDESLCKVRLKSRWL